MFHTVLTCVETQEDCKSPSSSPAPGEHGSNSAVAEEARWPPLLRSGCSECGEEEEGWGASGEAGSPGPE